MSDSMHNQPSAPIQQIEHQRALLDSAVSDSSVIFYVAEYGHGSRVRFVSSNFETVVGDAASSVLEKPRYWRRRMHPDDLAKYAEQTARLAVGETTTVKYRFKVADGSYRWYRDEIRRRPAGGERPDEIVGCMVDVTAEVDTLADYGEIKSIHTTIVDTAPFAIVAIDEAGRIVEFNHAAERMFAFTQDQVLGRSLSNTIIPERYRERHEQGLRRLRESGGVMSSHRRLDVQAQRADGSLFPASIVIAQAVWGDGSVFIAVITDLTEQVRAAEERRRLDQLLHDAVESLSEGFALYDADDRLVMCNERYREFHKNVSDVLKPGVAWIDLMRTEAERGLYVDAVGRIDDWVRERERYRREVRVSAEYELSNGRWVVGSNQRTHQGGFVVTLNDITDRKERERDLKLAHELLEDAIESLSEGFALWDTNDGLVMCNQTYRDFNELCADILVPGVTWLDLMRTGAERGQYAAAIGRIDEWLEQSIEDRRTLRTNHEYEISEGRWCLGSNRRTRHGGIVVTRIDITERKKMERALQESEAFNRRVLDACPVAIEMTEAESGAIVYESPASQILFGREPSLRTLYARDVFAKIEDYEAFLQTLNGRGRVVDMEVPLKRFDGSIFWGSLSARRVDYQGADYIVSTTFDLTERRATEAELARQREALHQSEKMTALGSLLAGVAHELNNPLTVVIGRALMLEETLKHTPQAAALEKLRTAAERCSQIVQTFLSMARQKEPTRQSARIERIVDAALEIVSYGLHADAIEVEVALDEGQPALSADASQLIQVFTNLFINAQQALAGWPQPRRIRVTGCHDPGDNSLVVRVADNGPGIAHEHLSRVFDPFFSTKQPGQGTGLGLSVSLGLVKAHHGSIDVSVPPSGGTVFTVRLPVTTPRAGHQAEDADRRGVDRAGRILVVEDEAEIAAMLAEFLRPLGHQVEIAESGKAALDRLEARAFDLVLTDMRMPDLDGRQLYDELRMRYPHLADRTIFITGDTLSGYYESFLAETGRPVIEKPFTPREICEIVTKELAHNR